MGRGNSLDVADDPLLPLTDVEGWNWQCDADTCMDAKAAMCVCVETERSIPLLMWKAGIGKVVLIIMCMGAKAVMCVCVETLMWKVGIGKVLIRAWMRRPRCVYVSRLRSLPLC